MGGRRFCSRAAYAGLEDVAMDPGAERCAWAPTPLFRRGEPAHEASIDDFWIDRCAVDNEQFGRFVDETGVTCRASLDLSRSQTCAGSTP